MQHSAMKPLAKKNCRCQGIEGRLVYLCMRVGARSWVHDTMVQQKR